MGRTDKGGGGGVGRFRQDWQRAKVTGCGKETRGRNRKESIHCRKMYSQH